MTNIEKLAYPSGISIVHDPILGFDLSGPTPIIHASLLAGAAVASIADFGLMVYARSRQLARVFSNKTVSI